MRIDFAVLSRGLGALPPARLRRTSPEVFFRQRSLERADVVPRDLASGQAAAYQAT